jgi:hypothetical protein
MSENPVPGGARPSGGPVLRRHLATVALALGAAVAATALHQAISPWVVHPDDHSYFLTHLLVDNYFAWSTQIVLLAVGFGLGSARRAPPLLVGAAMMVPFPLATGYEIFKDSTSHNLLPFELFVWVPLVLPATVGAVAGRFQRRRATHAQPSP